MKYICKHACIWRGVYVTPDTVVDMTEDELKDKKPQIDGSFAPLDANGTPKEAEDAPDEHKMTKEKYREKLANAGVHPSPTATRDELRKLYEQHFSTQSRKVEK